MRLPPRLFGPGNIIGDTALTSFMATIGRGAGFAVPFFVAAWFGVNTNTDAFFYVYGLILLLAGLFSPIVQSVIVPFIAEIKAENEGDVRGFLGSTLVISVLGLAVVGVLFVLVARPLLSFVSDFSNESLDLISRLLLETLPLLVLLVATGLLSGALNAYRKYSLPAISPGVRAVVALIVIFSLRERLGVHSIALGYVAGELIRFAVLLAAAASAGLAPSVRRLALDRRLSEFLRTASHQVIGIIALAFSPVVDKTMASWLAPGSVSVLEYANRLFEIPATFVHTGLFVVLLSQWSVNFYGGAKSRFRHDVLKTAKIVGGGALAVSILLILFRAPLVSLVYGHGEFPRGQLAAVHAVWAFYLIGLGPTLFGRVFVRAHLVLKNTRILMIAGIASLVLKVGLNFLFIRSMGLQGLALSTTIAESAMAILLLACFLRTRPWGEVENSPAGRSMY
jgi:putative peptidoglycan lipid II flippase